MRFLKVILALFILGMLQGPGQINAQEKTKTIPFELDLASFDQSQSIKIDIGVEDIYEDERKVKSLTILIATRESALSVWDRQYLGNLQSDIELPSENIAMEVDLEEEFDFEEVHEKWLHINPWVYFVPTEDWSGNVGFREEDDDLKMILRVPVLAVDGSVKEYHITAKACYIKEVNPCEELPGKDIRIVVGKEPQAIYIKQPSRIESLANSFLNRESGLFAAILGLIGILLAVLKEKIKDGFEWVLDELGKIGRGKLAERRFLKRYLDNITFNHKFLKLIGFDKAGISRPRLEEVFVSLRVSGYDRQPEAPIDLIDNEPEHREIATIPFATALKQNKNLVILGGPGAGKTTTLSYTLLAFAQKTAKDRFGIEENLLPIFIPLRRLSNSNNSILEDLSNENSQIISEDILKECPKNYFEKKLRNGDCIVLLDGLDEVTDERTHRQVAQKINNMVADFPDNRFIVTCRIAGWKNLLAGFRILETQDFSQDEIQRFIRGWHRAVITQAEHSRIKVFVRYDEERFKEMWNAHQPKVRLAIDIQSRKLMGAIDSNNRILAIAVNPMLLSLISLVHYTRSSLPKARGRTILYEQCLDLLIVAWDSTRDITSTIKIPPDKKETVLREIAFDFQLNGKGEDLRKSLEKLIEKITAKAEISTSVDKLLEDIESRSGLLIERSIDVLGFSHLTLQEYLAAKHIQLDAERYKFLRKHFDDQEWREVILLYAGLVDDATGLIHDIISVNSLDRFILAGHCIGDASQADSKVSEEIVERLLAELNNNDTPTDQLISALSAIAGDFEGDNAVSVSQKLSQRLITTLESESKSGDITLNSSNAISILSGARITRALPVLVGLINNEERAVRDEAVKALISFGNLALKDLENQIDSTGGADSIEPLVDVLAGINTGPSAKLLLKLYGLNDEKTDRLISLRLSQMLQNPFVEADLTEIEADDLPKRLQDAAPDENGWPYQTISSRPAFLAIDSKLRHDTTAMISDIENGAGEAVTVDDNPQLDRLSFKILFPSLLAYIKSMKKNKIASLKLYETLGFDPSDEDQNKFQYLGTQIKKSTSLNLDFALQNFGSGISGDGYSFEEKKGRKWFGWILTGYLILYFLWIVFLDFIWQVAYLDGEISNIDRYFDFDYFSRLNSLDGPKYTILFGILSLAFCITLIAFIKTRSKSKLLSKSMLGILFSPYARFLRILPYSTKVNVWAKLFLFQFTVLFFSYGTGIILDVGFDPDNAPWVWSLVMIPHILFCISSFFYVRYVLRENPIYQLLTLHPEGRKLITAG